MNSRFRRTHASTPYFVKTPSNRARPKDGAGPQARAVCGHVRLSDPAAARVCVRAYVRTGGSTGQHGWMASDLTRFLTAHEEGGTCATALAELRSGRKRSHWMWFVFPQVAGLGRSATAQRYAISGIDEARDYLAHPVLGPRLVECARALTVLPGDDPIAVLGGVDAQKLCSSMTLFVRAADKDEDCATFRAVLDRYFGGADDQETVRRLRV